MSLNTSATNPSKAKQNEDAWKARARSTARKINTGWWIQYFNLPITICAILIAAAILTGRYYQELPSTKVTLLSIGLILSAIATLTWLWSKRKFETPEESLIRVEESLQLENSLSAASAGIVPWPAERPPLHKTERNLTWHIPRTLLPTLLSLLLIITAFFIPIGTYAQTIANSPTPDSLAAMEAKLELLKDDDIVRSH